MPFLNWVNDTRARSAASEVPFHLLKSVSTYGDEKTAKENLLIQGDNLLALKALLPFYRGKVKCIYIDPPYNTGSAFEHYDDNLEHSQWLSMMYPRLALLKEFLKEDGVIFVNLDEEQQAYCHVMLDEIFGRKNFIGDLIWQKRRGGGNDSTFFAIDHDYILVYAKNKSIHKNKWRVSQSAAYQKRYKEIDEKGNRYYWDTLSRDGLQNPIKVELTAPDGTKFVVNSQKSKETIADGLVNGQIKFSKTKKGWSLHHRVYLSGVQVLRSILTTGTNKTASDENIALFGDMAFDYPKPENLIRTILELVTKEGDLVLDSFLGSGTTAAVALKMKRRFIGVEIGEQANIHCIPRLQKVISGELGGISKDVKWIGGGGFCFYKLGPSVFDQFGSVNKEVDFETLAAYIWQKETNTVTFPTKSPYLGTYTDFSIFLLYNGVLGDKRPDAGNVLTPKILRMLEKAFPVDGQKIIYGEAVIGLTESELNNKSITFKQIPYDVTE